MASWRDTILKEFVPNVSKLTLVADPDQLLTEEKLSLALRKRGFDMILFTDPVEFRYAYEAHYRSVWDEGKETNLVVILRVESSDLKNLPYDFLEAGRKLSFNLGDIFPRLSYRVISKLDRSGLDKLFEAQTQNPPMVQMGDNETMDFILRNVFGVAAETVSTDVDLLRILLRFHYGRIQLPECLARRLISTLKNHVQFMKWPLESIVVHADAFYDFLQERWAVYLADDQEEKSAHQYKYSGPRVLPFEHDDVRVYMDNLFAEGMLKPIDGSQAFLKKHQWAQCGMCSEENCAEERMQSLFQSVNATLPLPDARYSDWTTFAQRWGELAQLAYTGIMHNPADVQKFTAIRMKVELLFERWLSAHYAALPSLPPNNPSMVHHIVKYLAQEVNKNPDVRVAIIVVDGLAMDQWATIRKILQRKDDRLVTRESAVFAWIPTLTCVSRQAIFSGKMPFYFPESIHTTQREPQLWQQFWENSGLPANAVVYENDTDEFDPAEKVKDILVPGQTRVIAWVVGKIDKIMHGMQLGATGMHNQINLWCNDEYLLKLIHALWNAHFKVWLTSDHGNIECQGQKDPREGDVADLRELRVRVYQTLELCEQVAGKCPFASCWKPVGLPDNYFPLLASGQTAFTGKHGAQIGHGGLSLEEVIVPFIQLERKVLE